MRSKIGLALAIYL